MIDVEHVLVAYGNSDSYFDGAKYQILKCWEKWYSRNNVGVCVVTDKPCLFESYPVRIIQLSEALKFQWSLEGRQHFGIKLKSLHIAAQSTTAARVMLLDADMYWKSDPLSIQQSPPNKSLIMYKDEGFIMGSRNSSVTRYAEHLTGVTLQINDNAYQLSNQSKMFGSAIVSLYSENSWLLEYAFEIFSVIEPLVPAHTVEQFALAEAARLNNFTVAFGRRYTRDWSSTGKKEYVNPLLRRFFNLYGHTDFDAQLSKVHHIKTRRPLLELAGQKYRRWKK